MIEWEVDGDHLRVVDSDNTELVVSGDVRDVTHTDADIGRPVDDALEGTATELRFPHTVVYVRSLRTGVQRELDPSGTPLCLASGEYLIDVDTEIKTYVRADGRIRIERTDDYESVVVTFPDRRRIVLGFRSRQEFPVGTITIPTTPEGLANGLTYLSSAHKTASPDRSYPTLRGHPPLLEPGDSLDVPDPVRSRKSDTGIVLLVPPEFDWLFGLAPLAYYLQATVETAPIAVPQLRIPDEGIEVTFSPFPTFERDVERLLRKTFFLDCLVRNAGPHGTTLNEARLLDALEVDADRLYRTTPRDRLARYLAVPNDAIEHRMPEWHLAMYVEPEPDRVEALPFLLDRLALCYRPRTAELEGPELIERSLDDFYRGSPVGSGVGDVASVEIVKPELRTGKVHGWLAEGVPIDVFKSTTEAYYNRLEYLDEPSSGTRICVVLNDPSMVGEHVSVADIYRGRSEDLSIDVSIEEGCSVSKLERIFESSIDFVHYIGHCEDEGLRCSDGWFSASSLEQCSVETFFLNACGSFHEGRMLIDRGSVAGAVTFAQVLNDHAVKVGSTFAKLLVNGFSIERALELARCRIMMGKDYAVVGDGTHTLTQGEHRTPTTITLETLDDDRFLMTLECYSTQVTGSYYFPHTAGNEYASLCGNESNFIVDRAELVTFLEESAAPVIYDGDLDWSRSLCRRLQE